MEFARVRGCFLTERDGEQHARAKEAVRRHARIEDEPVERVLAVLLGEALDRTRQGAVLPPVIARLHLLDDVLTQAATARHRRRRLAIGGVRVGVWGGGG